MEQNIYFSSKALVLNHRINYWMRSSAIGIWETAVKEIIQADSFFVNDATIQAPRDYFRPCKYIDRINRRIRPACKAVKREFYLQNYCYSGYEIVVMV